MRSFRKKGEGPVPIPSGGNAAILVIVIATFILLYILFLPKDERDRILEQDSVARLAAGKAPGSVLIKENPGILTRVKDSEFDHSIPSFNLFTKTEDAVLKTVESVYVESSRGSTKGRSIVLAVKDKVENARLSFTVNDHSGNLIISHNDNDVFTGEVESFTEPISLDLKEENLVEFSTEPLPWWKPFSRNFYDLRDVKITGTVEKLDNKEAIQTIIIGQQEFELLDEAALTYFVDCSARDVGRLSIYINGKLLASRVPDCGSPEKWQVDPSDLSEGKNEFRFVAEQGTYLIDRVLLRTSLREPIFPLYFFSINSSVMRRIENNTVNSTLGLLFLEDGERKTATIEINNQKTRLDTRAANYSKNVDTFLVAGTNFLRIEPETTLNVVELKLVLDCRTAADCS